MNKQHLKSEIEREHGSTCITSTGQYKTISGYVSKASEWQLMTRAYKDIARNQT
jgi:hypothetical protein